MTGTAPSLPQGRQFYAILGKLLCEQKPEIASELSTLLDGETDLSKLEGYLNSFCNLHDLTPCQLKGPLLKHDLTETRKRFIEAIFLIYRPHRRALSVSLANLLQVHKAQISCVKSLFDAKYRNANLRRDMEDLAAKLREV